jgi:outer membrane lipoprotein-sorting protein
MISSCNQKEKELLILQNTIASIDTIKTIYYSQKQLIGNTQDSAQVIEKYRQFYYKELPEDSIVGAKAHIYFYDEDFVFLEDIYDGDCLIRKHNRDSAARIYDLLKYPELKKKPFWGKTSPYVIRYMLQYAIQHEDSYTFELGNDTLLGEIDCYCVKTVLNGKALMPGFYQFQTDSNRVETMTLFIDKSNYYPQRVRLEVYFKDDKDKIYFTDNSFYNLEFNPVLSDSLFNTNRAIVKGFRINEIKP